VLFQNDPSVTAPEFAADGAPSHYR
jgi:hypothetical protein